MLVGDTNIISKMIVFIDKALNVCLGSLTVIHEKKSLSVKLRKVPKTLKENLTYILKKTFGFNVDFLSSSHSKTVTFSILLFTVFIAYDL